MAALLLATPCPAARAGDAGPPLELNEDYIEGLDRAPALDLDDPIAVFRFVFSKLRDDVTVYPTENYYYFSFHVGGIEYAGNIRLDALDRDDGIAHFAYYTDYTLWNEIQVSGYRPLDTQDGVVVEKRAPLVYDVTFEGRTVTFRLNDLRDVRPHPDMLAPGEAYVGPVYDESGLSFYFVYSRTLKQFHYVLNEEVSAPELYLPLEGAERVVIGQRTGFAFVEDRHRRRRLLVGVFETNSAVNNYLDGPFDQLPDNFIEGDSFREMLEHAFPAVEGMLDRFGNSDGGASRLLITPYIYYANFDDLLAILECADAAAEDDEAAYYACFNTGQPDYNQLWEDRSPTAGRR